MATRRVYVGARFDGTGVFVSKSGYDAYTASDENLLLNISEKTSRLLKWGRATAPGTLALGYGIRPHMILTGFGDYSAIPETAWPSFMRGATRPSPVVYGLTTNNNMWADIENDGSYMTLFSGSGSQNVYYEIYNEVAT